jgi:hypothetical protein
LIRVWLQAVAALNDSHVCGGTRWASKNVFAIACIQLDGKFNLKLTFLSLVELGIMYQMKIKEHTW